MAVHLKSKRQINRIVSHLPGVRGAVRDKADEIAREAETRLSAHRVSGRASVEVTYGRIDSFVSLVDPHNAMAIEFGHKHNRTGENVEGLYIITGAAGLI